VTQFPNRTLALPTGRGGLIENIPRVLPDGLGVALDGKDWKAPPVFAWLASQGVAEQEMARVFNCGIGMVALVSPDMADGAVKALEAGGLAVRRIGSVQPAKGERVAVHDLAAAWRA
jgi:phosphoribosylformylglycinamidine cyclo-ligase